MNFVVVEAWVNGTTPMLQHRATEEALGGKTRSNSPGHDENPRSICERAVYRMPNQQLAIPGAAFARMIREAGGAHKSRSSRKSLKYIVPAAMLVLDDLCPIFLNDRKTPLKNYEVDSRPVTIPATKGRIIRHRARFNEWSSKVTLRINEDILDQPTIRKLMVEGLQQIGLGDYRPEKGGPFGTSDLVAWNVISAAKLATTATKHAAGLKAV